MSIKYILSIITIAGKISVNIWVLAPSNCLVLIVEFVFGADYGTKMPEIRPLLFLEIILWVFHVMKES